MSDRENKRKIAKLVYKDIKDVMDKWEDNPDSEIKCCWDECLWVDDEFFTYQDFYEEKPEEK